MESTRNALLMLVVFWSLQVLGAWWQWRHLQRSLGSATRGFADGFLGFGKSPRRWGFGTIALLVVGPDLSVRKLQATRGFSVMARLRDLPEYEGLSLQALQSRLTQAETPRPLADAVRAAIGQIEQVRREP